MGIGPSPPSRRTERLPAAEIAARYGLAPAAARPSLLAYLRQLWGRRHFLVAFTRGKVTARYARASLGALWQVLTPMLQGAVYLLLFGLLLQVHRGVDNFIGFLAVGVFIFSFTSHAMNRGARAISGNLGLVRALHFPRATLPLAFTLAELRLLGPSLVVLAVIVLLTGEPLTAAWLLVPAAVALQFLFNIGVALVMARIGAHMRDVQQVLPFITRTWLYLSGIFFSIPTVARRLPEAIGPILMFNPAAVYIDLVRRSLLSGHDASLQIPHAWPVGAAWAVVVLVIGFVFFWQAEEQYGRG